MRGWILNAALCVVFLAVPAWGQRGGGGHGGGGGGFHGGGGGYHGGGFAGGSHGGYWGGGYRGNGWGYSGYGYRGYGYGGYGYRGYGYGGYGYGYRGYGWGYPGWGWSYPWWGASWYPWWGWNSWDDSDNSYPSDTYAPSNYQAQPYPSSVYVTPGPPPGYSYSQQNQTQDEIDSLKNQVAQLRSQQEEKSAPPTKPEPHEKTVLVYRDGHTEQVDNYAIAGKTLWVFNETRARRVALSELDLPATKRDNEDRGIDFIIPRASQPASHHSD